MVENIHSLDPRAQKLLSSWISSRMILAYNAKFGDLYKLYGKKPELGKYRYALRDRPPNALEWSGVICANLLAIGLLTTFAVLFASTNLWFYVVGMIVMSVCILFALWELYHIFAGNKYFAIVHAERYKEDEWRDELKETIKQDVLTKSKPLLDKSKRQELFEQFADYLPPAVLMSFRERGDAILWIEESKAKYTTTHRNVSYKQRGGQVHWPEVGLTGTAGEVEKEVKVTKNTHTHRGITLVFTLTGIMIAGLPVNMGIIPYTQITLRHSKSTKFKKVLGFKIFPIKYPGLKYQGESMMIPPLYTNGSDAEVSVSDAMRIASTIRALAFGL